MASNIFNKLDNSDGWLQSLYIGCGLYSGLGQIRRENFIDTWSVILGQGGWPRHFTKADLARQYEHAKVVLSQRLEYLRLIKDILFFQSTTYSTLSSIQALVQIYYQILAKIYYQILAQIYYQTYVTRQKLVSLKECQFKTLSKSGYKNCLCCEMKWRPLFATTLCVHVRTFLERHRPFRNLLCGSSKYLIEVNRLFELDPKSSEHSITSYKRTYPYIVEVF